MGYSCFYKFCKTLFCVYIYVSPFLQILTREFGCVLKYQMVETNYETFQSSIIRYSEQLSFSNVFMIRPGKWSKWSFKTEGPNLCTEFVETVWGIIWSS